MKVKRPAVLAQARLGNLILGVATIAIAPAAHYIEVFQGEALWIDFLVTGGAALVCAMLFKLLANGDCSTRIGIDGRHAGGRRRNDLSQNPLADPFAANDRGSRRAVRGDLKDNGLGHHSTADT